jgi:hypothetical protein
MLKSWPVWLDRILLFVLAVFALMGGFHAAVSLLGCSMCGPQ